MWPSAPGRGTAETAEPDAAGPAPQGRAAASPRCNRCLFVLSWYLFSTPLLLVLPVVNDLLWGRLTILQTVEILVPFYIALIAGA